jgi:hypothetical protein
LRSARSDDLKLSWKEWNSSCAIVARRSSQPNRAFSTMYVIQGQFSPDWAVIAAPMFGLSGSAVWMLYVRPYQSRPVSG